MSKNKILLIGDSFASSNHPGSWTTMLPNFDIVNLSSNGSSEYRIFKKLVKTDLTKFNYIIIVHTSPYRIYVEHNPLHLDSQTHQTCDLIYQDVKSAESTQFTQNVAWYFKNVFSLDQADTIHDLLVEKIVKLTATHSPLHLSFFKDEKNSNIVNLHSIWHEHPGSINHLDYNGNKKVAKFIITMYNKFTNNQKDLL
jgi:hypothetical protein